MKTYRNNGFALTEGILIFAVIGLIGFVGWYVYRQHSESAPPVGPSFKVVGNQIIAPNGKQFVPYGVVMECAAEKTSNTSTLCTGKDYTGNTGSAVVAATAKDWNAKI